MYGTSVFYFRCYKLGQVSKKITLFSLPLRSLYVCNSFLFLFFRLLVRFFPNVRFSNRSDSFLRMGIKLSLSPRDLIAFTNELLFSHGTLSLRKLFY